MASKNCKRVTVKVPKGHVRRVGRLKSRQAKRRTR